MSLGQRLGLKVGGERRSEMVVQGSGRLSKLRKCSMAALGEVRGHEF